MKKLALLLPVFLFASCFEAERDCPKFKTGEFEFTYQLNGKTFKGTFKRNDSLELETVNGRVDTNRVKWISDCEWLVQKLHPKSNAEKKAVHMKILSTTGNSYIFEYNLVGDLKNKQRGKATKTN